MELILEKPEIRWVKDPYGYWIEVGAYRYNILLQQGHKFGSEYVEPEIYKVVESERTKNLKLFLSMEPGDIIENCRKLEFERFCIENRKEICTRLCLCVEANCNSDKITRKIAF